MTGPESADSRQHGIIRLTSPTQFPATLRRLRHQAGLTKLELARRSGLSETTIDYHETGKFTPTLDSLTKLANALNHPVALIDQELRADYLNGVSDTLTLIRNELDRQAAGDTDPTRQLLDRLAGALGLDEEEPS